MHQPAAQLPRQHEVMPKLRRVEIRVVQPCQLPYPVTGGAALCFLPQGAELLDFLVWPGHRPHPALLGKTAAIQV